MVKEYGLRSSPRKARSLAKFILRSAPDRVRHPALVAPDVLQSIRRKTGQPMTEFIRILRGRGRRAEQKLQVLAVGIGALRYREPGVP